MAAHKTRLDQLLVELGYFPSCEQARTSIMSNRVRIGGVLANKAGQQINPEKFYNELEVNPEHLKVEDLGQEYVSRGAYKLKAATEQFELKFNGKMVLDIGSSTGGFTDYVLRQGALAVIALDVGKVQLDLSLRNNPAVLSIESENFRYSNPSRIASLCLDRFKQEMRLDYLVADLSFISITKILDKVKEFIIAYGHPETLCVFLIKPQFEASKQDVDKCAGVIRDPDLRERVLNGCLETIQEHGFELKGLIESPIKGAKGNLEYLALLRAI
jgi:23S rRNA (cytidine1920-2'-O)/16S rRNA (cytidine1409-2'-O)-methyltransferase